MQDHTRKIAKSKERKRSDLKRHDYKRNIFNTAAPSSKVAPAQSTSPQRKSCADACSYASTNNVVRNIYEACYEKDL